MRSFGRPDVGLVLAGHTHIPFDRTLDDVRIFNNGSVSNPVTGDQRAMWTLLEADEEGYTLHRQHAPYDCEAYLRHVAELRHPAETKIRAFFEQAAGT